ncbi:MAG: VWA domain-containing protein [Labilithrix sp.]|nr:VWA domain-containing protein [Labilithrix sp.]MCW5816449.1 VWA domain-containing protein [Labilithrix sp.]
MSNSKIDPNTVLGLANLFASANASGTLSNQSRRIITGNLGAVVIAGAAGKDNEDILTSDVTLVTLLVDASSSIHQRGLEDAVRAGQNLLVDALACSTASESVLMALWTFNEDVRVVHSYVGVGDATRLDKKTYNAAGSTRLYDTWCDALAANVAYAQQLRDGGTPCRSVVVVITDGEDCGSKRRASDCATLSRDLLASEQFILAFVGVGTDVDFRAVAKAMGVPDGCVTVQAQATPQGMRKVFGLVKQSTIRASQGVIKPGPNTGFF